jgi:opacity protein-like surface antigen
MKRIYEIAVVAGLLASAAAAQDAVMQKQMAEEISTALRRVTVIGMEGGVMSNVKNAPYRADQITESTQILGDGTRIHNEHQMTIYRDSQGRIRRETPDGISIWDPNSGIGYNLNPKTMTGGKMQVSVNTSGGAGSIGVAYRAQAGANSSGPVAPGGADDIRLVTKTIIDGETKVVTARGGVSNKESLGMRIMEGVSAQGERRTSTIETGAIGNDRPIQSVNERWYSPDLQVEVMTRNSDPRSGELVTRLVNISRAEPDPSLFQIPAGYQIEEPKQLPALFRSKQ